MSYLLQGVVDRGTGLRLRGKYQLKNQMGGKTGTTQNHSNGWFMGLTPNLVAGVWTGWEDQAIHFEEMSVGQASNMALPVVGIFLQKLFADPELGSMVNDVFEVPANLSINLDCAGIKSTKNIRDAFRDRDY
jgi:penicillin-binding protein 1A